MPATKLTIMTILQKIRGQSLTWVTLLLAASLPAQSLAEPVLSHRVIPTSTSRLRGRIADEIIREVLEAVPVPIER